MTGELITIRNSMNARIHVTPEEFANIIQLAQDEYGIVAKPKNVGEEPRKIKVAENITVDSQGILIDGMRLPYYLAADDVQVVIDQSGPHWSEVRITLLAETVSVTPDVVVESDGDVTMISPEEGS